MIGDKHIRTSKNLKDKNNFIMKNNNLNKNNNNTPSSNAMHCSGKSNKAFTLKNTSSVKNSISNATECVNKQSNSETGLILAHYKLKVNTETNVKGRYNAVDSSSHLNNINTSSNYNKNFSNNLNFNLNTKEENQTIQLLDSEENSYNNNNPMLFETLEINKKLFKQYSLKEPDNRLSLQMFPQSSNLKDTSFDKKNLNSNGHSHSMINNNYYSDSKHLENNISVSPKKGPFPSAVHFTNNCTIEEENDNASIISKNTNNNNNYYNNIFKNYENNQDLTAYTLNQVKCNQDKERQLISTPANNSEAYLEYQTLENQTNISHNNKNKNNNNEELNKIQSNKSSPAYKERNINNNSKLNTNANININKNLFNSPTKIANNNSQNINSISSINANNASNFTNNIHNINNSLANSNSLDQQKNTSYKIIDTVHLNKFLNSRTNNFSFNTFFHSKKQTTTIANFVSISNQEGIKLNLNKNETLTAVSPIGNKSPLTSRNSYLNENTKLNTINVNANDIQPKEIIENILSKREKLMQNENILISNNLNLKDLKQMNDFDAIKNNYSQVIAGKNKDNKAEKCQIMDNNKSYEEEANLSPPTLCKQNIKADDIKNSIEISKSLDQSKNAKNNNILLNFHNTNNNTIGNLHSLNLHNSINFVTGNNKQNNESNINANSNNAIVNNNNKINNFNKTFNTHTLKNKAILNSNASKGNSSSNASPAFNKITGNPSLINANSSFPINYLANIKNDEMSLKDQNKQKSESSNFNSKTTKLNENSSIENALITGENYSKFSNDNISNINLKNNSFHINNIINNNNNNNNISNYAISQSHNSNNLLENTESRSSGSKGKHNLHWLNSKTNQSQENKMSLNNNHARDYKSNTNNTITDNSKSKMSKLNLFSNTLSNMNSNCNSHSIKTTLNSNICPFSGTENAYNNSINNSKQTNINRNLKETGGIVNMSNLASKILYNKNTNAKQGANSGYHGIVGCERPKQGIENNSKYYNYNNNNTSNANNEKKIIQSYNNSNNSNINNIRSSANSLGTKESLGRHIKTKSSDFSSIQEATGNKNILTHRNFYPKNNLNANSLSNTGANAPAILNMKNQNVNMSITNQVANSHTINANANNKSSQNPNRDSQEKIKLSNTNANTNSNINKSNSRHRKNSYSQAFISFKGNKAAIDNNNNDNINYLIEPAKELNNMIGFNNNNCDNTNINSNEHYQIPGVGNFNNYNKNKIKTASQLINPEKEKIILNFSSNNSSNINLMNNSQNKNSINDINQIISPFSSNVNVSASQKINEIPFKILSNSTNSGPLNYKK